MKKADLRESAAAMAGRTSTEDKSAEELLCAKKAPAGKTAADTGAANDRANPESSMKTSSAVPGETAQADQMPTVNEQKKALRKEKLKARRAIDAEARKIADQAIVKAVLSLPELRHYESIVAYATDGTEPDLAEVIGSCLRAGKRVSLPRFATATDYDMVHVSGEELRAGKWGIPEPGPDAEKCSGEELGNSLWLVPGVAFDEGGWRLGRGKGVYDRLLSQGYGRSIGIFYECQRCAKIPRERYDRALDVIVTENGVYRTGTQEPKKLKGDN